MLYGFSFPASVPVEFLKRITRTEAITGARSVEGSCRGEDAEIVYERCVALTYFLTYQVC